MCLGFLCGLALSPRSTKRDHVQKKVPSQEEGPTLQLLSQPHMPLLLTSHFLVNLNLGVVGTFAFDRAVQLGLSPGQASLILSVMGVSNILGRVVFGQVLDRWRPHALLLTTVVLASHGLSTILGEFTPSFPAQAALAALYGSSQGAYFSSQVVVLQLLGRSEAVTVALGLVLGARGLASLAGPLAAGLARDATGSYTPGFLSGGVLVLVAALLLLLLRRKDSSRHPSLEWRHQTVSKPRSGTVRISGQCIDKC